MAKQERIEALAKVYRDKYLESVYPQMPMHGAREWQSYIGHATIAVEFYAELVEAINTAKTEAETDSDLRFEWESGSLVCISEAFNNLNGGK